MRSFFWLVAFNLLIVSGFSQTCVIAKVSYQNNDTCIVIGSDTKFGNYTYNDKTRTVDTTYTHGHKIFNKGQYTYVTIGYGAGIQRKLADSILNLHLSVDRTLNLYLNQFEKVINADLAYLKKRSPVLYNKMVPENTSIVSSTMFALFDHGRPYLAHLLFVKNPFGVTTMWRGGDLSAGGELQAIQNKLNDKRSWSAGSITAIKMMLKAEATDRPDKVGLPFEFIIIRKNKVEQFTDTHY